MIRYDIFHIHGDNIVECERAFALILQALNHQNLSVSTPMGSPVCPEYHITVSNQVNPIKVTFYPGFGRWDKNILNTVRERGGVLREAADVIITGVSKGQEELLIAIEFCGALPAGNQAWQRNGRAYSFGKAGIPYFYVAELGGYELDNERQRKAPRMPNPAVPFSYLTYSNYQNIVALPIFTASLGADEESRKLFADEFSSHEFVNMLRAIIYGTNQDMILMNLQHKVVSFVQKRANANRSNQALTARQWQEAYELVMAGDSIVDYLVQKAPLSWAKIAYIDSLTNSARALMNLTKNYAIGLTSTNLPMCIINKDNRPDFADQVVKLYNNLPDDFIAWLKRSENLTICWVMGFKPRGDDARPDRGLPPMTRMLIGDGQDLLSVIYGPAPLATWQLLLNAPSELMVQNGLWEAILQVSDAVLVDSSTDNQTRHGLVRSHWMSETPMPEIRPFFVSPRPKHIGENDVDTVLHTILAKFTGSEVFEGMCNPPGGDWSGISLLLPPERDIELRWLSLPRVSGENTKRPDHVFQIFSVLSQPIILCVESKEKPGSVEKEIGPQVIAYVANLMESPANTERIVTTDNWHHSEKQIDRDDFVMASAVAFISSDKKQILNVQKKSSADLLFCFEFAQNGGECTLQLVSSTKIGMAIANYICNIDISTNHIKVKILP